MQVSPAYSLSILESWGSINDNLEGVYRERRTIQFYRAFLLKGRKAFGSSDVFF
jgi:hypothetical protein